MYSKTQAATSDGACFDLRACLVRPDYSGQKLSVRACMSTLTNNHLAVLDPTPLAHANSTIR